VAARLDPSTQRWYLVPDPRSPSGQTVLVMFYGDASGTAPTLRLRPTGTEFPLTPTGTTNVYRAALDLHGVAPGGYAIDVVERLAPTPA